jgi:TonB family protein
MPEVLNTEPVETAIHDASGAVKLHTDPDDHLARLLAPQNMEMPVYKSLYQAIHDVFKPKQLPPLEVTSKPVAVKDIWGLYGNDPKSFGYSLGLQAIVVTILFLVGTNSTVQTAVKKQLGIIDPNLRPYIPDQKPKAQANQGGGGGGAREPLPVSKGQAPKPAPKQFVPPQIVDHTPKLAIAPSLILPPDAALPQNNLPNWGDPLASMLNGSNGQGSGGGMGNGKGGGLGPGSGGGYGPGEGGGLGGGVFRVGGGVSAPSVLFKVDPEYSEEARKAKYSGTVLLSVIVDTEGHARDIRVVKSLGMGLDEKAVEAVQKWKFKPGMKGNAAVNVRAQIEVNFRLL